jgi:hypothetical protein
MPRNDKSFRLQALRDRLHITGQHAPTFIQSVQIMLEIIGLVKSRRNLACVRRDVQKLRDRTPDMTVDQLQRFEMLEQKLARKYGLAGTREQRRADTVAKKKAAAAEQVAPPAPPAPAPGEKDVWDM